MTWPHNSSIIPLDKAGSLTWRWPVSRSHAAGSCGHWRPACSAPLACHRSCHVWPGWLASQSSILPRRRCRLSAVSGLPARNGPSLSRCTTSSRACPVCHHRDGTARGPSRPEPGWILVFTALPVLYLLPTLVGAIRRVDRLALVFLVNLIGAPTGVGWVAAMILAFGPRRPSPAPPPTLPWTPSAYRAYWRDARQVSTLSTGGGGRGVLG